MKCPVRIYARGYRDFTGQPCGRPVAEGESKCNFHLGVAQRKARRQEERDREYAAKRELRDEMRRRCDAIGGGASPLTLSDGSVSLGRVVVNVEWLEALVARAGA